MALPDLLQWLATAGKTGALRIERNRITKVICMKAGRIIGCSSDDPPNRLGQYLLSRDRISADQLRQALASQAETGQHLGRILVEMGALAAEDLTGHLESKAEETIYSIFDWSDAVFRFHDDAEPEDGMFPVELRVEDVLLRGLQRFDEMARIRQVLHDPAVILRYTNRPPGDGAAPATPTPDVREYHRDPAYSRYDRADRFPSTRECSAKRSTRIECNAAAGNSPTTCSR